MFSHRDPRMPAPLPGHKSRKDFKRGTLEPNWLNFTNLVYNVAVAKMINLSGSKSQ